MILAERSFILLASRKILILSLTMLTIILPLSFIPLKRGDIHTISILLPIIEPSIVASSIRIHNLCLAYHLILYKSGRDDPAILEGKFSVTIFLAI